MQYEAYHSLWVGDTSKRKARFCVFPSRNKGTKEREGKGRNLAILLGIREGKGRGGKGREGKGRGGKGREDSVTVSLGFMTFLWQNTLGFI